MQQFSSLCLSLTAAFALARSVMKADPRTGSAEKNTAVATSRLAVEPSGFEENKGQVLTTAGDAAPFVRYRLSKGNTSIFLLGNGIAYQFNRLHYPVGYAELEKDVRPDPTKQKQLDSLRKGIDLETYRMDVLLEGANADARITTEGRSDDHTQYYNHNALDVHTYSRVTYHEVYPGIDWVVYSTDKGMEYDFVLRPGADPSKIQLHFKDQEELHVDANGQLIQGNRMGRITEERPVSFQNGKTVDSRFVLDGDRLSFALGAYDHSQSLTIDPALIWATYYGESGEDQGTSCAVGDSASVYLAGYTTSTYAIASGGHQNTFGGGIYDAFLVKFSASGVRQWGTYYGGVNNDYGNACAVDGSGNVYLAGTTSSTTAIASGGHQNTIGGYDDAFLVKFKSNGLREWGTYYGGAGSDQGQACAVDGSDNVYLAGTTYSGAAIAFEGHQNNSAGNGDALLVKFSSSGVRQWGTYYGGAGGDLGYSCAVDDTNNVYLAGATSSTTGIASGGHQNTIGGGGASDAYLVKFNASGVRQWGTYYGGALVDNGSSCAVDDSGNVYLAGGTYSPTAISSDGLQNTYGGYGDAFLVKFNGSGVRQWGTYYGGGGFDQGQACTVDDNNNVYLAGNASSFNGIASGGGQNTCGGGGDAFLVKFNASGVRQWGTYHGGTGDDVGYSCAVDDSDHVYMAGSTGSDTAIASGGYQNTYGGDGGYDAFLAKFEGTAPFDGIASVQDPQEPLPLWPNPNTGDRFFLQSPSTGPTEIQLFDALGQLQRTWHMQTTPGQAPVEVALGSELAKGLYMVRVTMEGRSSVAPLVIE